MYNVARDILEFHSAMGLTSLTDAEALEAKRKRLIDEETRELSQAVETGEIGHIVAETMDLVYVLIGRLVERGISPAQIDAVWSAVHGANMDKEAPGDPMDKPTKPPGWEAANIEAAMLAKLPTSRWFVSGVGEAGFWNTILDVEGAPDQALLGELQGEMGPVIGLAKISGDIETLEIPETDVIPDEPTIENIERLMATGLGFYDAQRALATYGTVAAVIEAQTPECGDGGGFDRG